MEKEIFWKLLLSYLFLLVLSAGVLAVFKISYLAVLIIMVSVISAATVISSEYVRHIDEISNAIHNISRGRSGGFTSRRSANEFRRLEDAVSELQGKLQRLEKMRTEFVANVSHELKTPLTSIKASVDTLLGGALEDKKHNVDFLNKINSNSERLSALIDDLLELSDIENKITPRSLKACDMNEITARAIEIVLPKAKARGITIVNRLHNNLVNVLCDEDHISRVLLNLLDNAIKYNIEGGEINISSAEQDGYIRIEVADSGIGIEEKHFPRLFERFYTVDKARSRELGGTGLGLSIAKHIVELHGGKIWASSVPGKGSTFSFTLKKA